MARTLLQFVTASCIAFFAYLGSPALLREKDSRIIYLEEQVRDLENERKDLQNRLLERHGVRPLDEPTQAPSPAMQREVVQPFEDWRKKDMLDELADLKELAEQDPVGYGSLYEEATLRYNEVLNPLSGE